MLAGRDLSERTGVAEPTAPEPPAPTEPEIAAEEYARGCTRGGQQSRRSRRRAGGARNAQTTPRLRMHNSEDREGRYGTIAKR